MEREANPTAIHSRYASFSSYLTRAEGNLVFKSPALNMNRRIDQDGEISVFGAERYFSMMLEDDSPRVLVDYNNSSRLQQQKQAKSSRPGTPSTFSDASWNCRATYSPSWRSNRSPSVKKNVNGKKSFSGFICSGTCSDQKSIHVREANVPVARDCKRLSFGTDHQHIKQSQPRFKSKEDQTHVVFPNFEAKEEKKAKQEPRKSLQVFASAIMKKEEDSVAMHLERRLSMLSWDAIPKAQNQSITSGNNEMINDDDDASDASSDLFEIENLTSIACSVVTTAASDHIEKKVAATKQLQ